MAVYHNGGFLTGSAGRKEEFLTFKQGSIICDVRKILHWMKLYKLILSSIGFFKLYLFF